MCQCFLIYIYIIWYYIYSKFFKEIDIDELDDFVAEKLYQEYLLENGIDQSQIISINFEELEYEELQDYKKLYHPRTAPCSQAFLRFAKAGCICKFCPCGRPTRFLFVRFPWRLQNQLS